MIITKTRDLHLVNMWTM